MGLTPRQPGPRWAPSALGAAVLLFGLACATLTGGPAQAPTLAPAATLAPEPTLPPQPTPPAFTPPSEAGNAPQEVAVPDEGVNHIPEGQRGTYAHHPPSSGVHYNRILAWDVYADVLPPEYFVHNLEHGGIVVLYDCPAGCPETEAALQEFFARAPPEDVFNSVKIVVGQYEGLESPVVALAWGYQLDLPAADVDRLLDFYNRYVNQGPELAP